MKELLNSFPNLSDRQITQFELLNDLYRAWNSKINVISRKDIDNLYTHHVLHSLAIAKYIQFEKGTTIMDVGTGGGFPGIPLAILFPDVHFVLLDSIRKKIRVVQEVSAAIGLTNTEAIHARVQDEQRKFHFVVSRAVMSLPDLVGVVRKNINNKEFNAHPNGLICLKGGDLTSELDPFKEIVEVIAISDYFSNPFFETKKLVYLPL